MTEQEFRENMYKGNRYKCGFCGKTITDKPTLTLCVSRGMAIKDISDICESCVDKIKQRAIC